MNRDKLKRRLGITHDEQDILLDDLLDDASSAFKVITGDDVVPKKYEFMVTNVAAKLYNRSGSEGMESESVDGHNVKYVSNLFNEYMDILNRDYNLNSQRQRGGFKFI